MQNAEQLIILGDIGSGLLARLYMYTTFAKPDLLTNDPNVVKYLKQMVTTWPQFPQALDKVRTPLLLPPLCLPPLS